jgi:hypothetical protein
MVNLKNSIEIGATPDEVWSILSNLRRSPEYVPGIISAQMEGLTRVCLDANGNEIREELQYYSVQERTYSLRHIRVPLPVSQSQMRFSVQPHAQKSRVTLTWEFNFLDPAMQEQLQPMIDGSAKMTLEQLKTLVEKEK